MLMRAIRTAFIFILAVILVFEEWLWDWLKFQLHKLSRLRWVHAFENALHKLNPTFSLIILLIPILILFPFKLAALYAISHGYQFSGFLVFIAAKIVGTGAGAYLFDLVKDNALKIHWFRRIYEFIVRWVRKAHRWLHEHPIYQDWQKKLAQFRSRSLWRRQVRITKNSLKK